MLSVIYKKPVKEAFSQILSYYAQPNSKVVDVACGEMLMWSDELKKQYQLTTMDIRQEVNPTICNSCINIEQYFKEKSVDCIIFDPPYINLKRLERDKREDIYQYQQTNSLDDLENLYKNVKEPFFNVLKENGSLIVKITNFHIDGQLKGTYNIVNWLKSSFYIFDEIIYRYYKHIPNLNWYKKKVAKTHSYFLIFKKEKKK